MHVLHLRLCMSEFFLYQATFRTYDRSSGFEGQSYAYKCSSSFFKPACVLIESFEFSVLLSYM